MLKHDQIMKAKFIRFTGGEVVDVDTEEETGQLVFVEGSVAGEYVNLLRASAVMYQTLAYEREQLNALIEAASALPGAEAIIPKFEEMLAPIELTLTLAIEGVEAYIQEPKQ